MNLGTFDTSKWREAAEKFGKPRIAIVGFAGAGKSLMVNSLFGTKVASVNARAGWTVVPQFVEHGLFELIDTPGFGSDGWEERVFVEQIIEPAHLVIHLINGASGLTDYDRDMYDLVKRHPGLIIVLNKIDILDRDERREAIEGILDVLPMGDEDLVLASGKQGTGLRELVNQMTELLPRTMKSSFVGALSGEQFTEQRAELAQEFVHYYATVAGAVGCVPIPVADIAILAPLQIAMFLHISRIFGHHFSKEQAGSIVGSLLSSVGARTAAQAVVSIVKAIPGLGSVLGAAAGGAMAATTFEAFGNVVILYFKHEQKISPEEIRDYYANQYAQAKKRYANKDD